MSDSSTETLYRDLIHLYLNDEVGKQMWLDSDMASICDVDSKMMHIFMHGACVDFANALSVLTGWPIYEIQWGDAISNDPDDCEELKGIHRVIQHPSGHYFDASGWTSLEDVLEIFDARELSYIWMGEVDYGAEVFNVDPELIKRAAISLMPEDCLLATENHCKSTSSMGM